MIYFIKSFKDFKEYITLLGGGFTLYRNICIMNFIMKNVIVYDMRIYIKETELL